MARWQIAIFILTLLALALHFLIVSDVPLIVVLLLGGLPLAWQILSKLIRGDWGADSLAVLSLIAAFWMHQYLAGALIVLMLASGQVLEAYAMRKASSALLALSKRMPSVAHRQEDAHVSDIALSDIHIGDAIVIYPHESAPVDGAVIEGHGTMDESYLTGEPYLVSKAPGAAVLSGAINGDSLLIIRTEKLPQDSRYAKIMTVMQEAEQKRPAMRRMGDQIGAVFAPVALACAIGAWLWTGDATRFLAVLVIATPCPLLIAIPLTLVSAISMAARRGIIIRDPVVLERLPTCRTAIFDKTGTLTYGKPTLTEVLVAPNVNQNETLQNAASLERYSKHPLASAVLQAAQQANLLLPDATNISEKPGQGLTGIIHGHTYVITHRNKLLKTHPELASQLPPSASGLECTVLKNDQYQATFRFHDAPRAEGKSFITHLAPHHLFEKIMLVSGDRDSEVSYLAEQLGIKNALASQSPEQKVGIVREETAKAPTLFMGDGINDAPALATATVGIAFGQHSNVTAEAAGAVILESTLIKVDELIHISAAMRRIALQSAIGGMALSLLGMGFAAAGLITPVAGALLQEGIDVLAILNALRMAWGSRIVTDVN